MNEETFFNNLWKKVDNWKKPGGAYRTKEVDPLTSEFIKTLKKGTLLDIGCGGGRDCIAFAKAGLKVTGTDFAPEAIKLAKILAKENNVKIKFLVDDILNTKLKERFDIINDVGCLHHLRANERKIYLKNLKKLTHKNSIIRIQVLNNYCKKVFSNKNKPGKNYILQKGHYTKFFNKEELKELFKDYKIKMTRIDRGRTKSLYELVLLQ